MIPAGYMAKRVTERPAWLDAAVRDIYSVSDCISPAFADFINYWRHNGYWFFNSPEGIEQLAGEHSIALQGTKLFYFEVFEQQYDDDWQPFPADASFETRVSEPDSKQLEGFDVVSFSGQTTPECSPLSCNSLASELPVNEHCLLRSQQEAMDLIESGRLERAEPGPYRLFAVYSVGTPWPPGGRLTPRGGK
jgi:hypothetical protein